MNELRIDKYLFFARFCKSRNLAQTWIDAGEVLLNGRVVVKCNITIRPGDRIELPRGRRQRHLIEVTALAERRGGAPEAEILYRSLDITAVV
jgi:ribosome-associated heat shock protein Hsp15